MTSHSNIPQQSFRHWKAVNTMQNQPLDPIIIGRMDARVYKYYGDPMVLPGSLPADTVPHEKADAESLEIFMLEVEKEFKFGKGKALVAIADGGKNKVGNDIKYVRWYNLYGKETDNSKNKLKIMNKTYTYGVVKARQFWDEKINEGYNRVK